MWLQDHGEKRQAGTGFGKGQGQYAIEWRVAPSSSADYIDLGALTRCSKCFRRRQAFRGREARQRQALSMNMGQAGAPVKVCAGLGAAGTCQERWADAGERAGPSLRR